MTHRSLGFASMFALVAQLACGPGKDPGETDTDPTSSSGTPTTAPTSSSGTNTGTSAPPTSSEPSPSSNTAEPDPTSTTSETDGSSSSTTEPPLGPCEERQTEADCLATTLGGHNTCAWQTGFALWSERAGCGSFAGPPRCLPVHYVGDGCQVPDCPGFSSVYFRELEDGVVELIDYGGCGLNPDGWKLCLGIPAEDPPACACFC